MSYNDKKIPLIVICGPTASGKTALAVDTALLLDGEVVSADSMQVYKELSIITARPDEKEKRGVPHHLMGIIGLEESFSLADYLKLAKQSIADIYSRGKMPILCGGTGLYISSLIENIKLDENASDPALRTQITDEAREYGIMKLWHELEAADPTAAAKIHPNNEIRVIRAVEILRSSGMTPTEHNRQSRLEETPYDAMLFEPSFRCRDELYERINKRVDIMVQKGMVEEARGIYLSSDPATARQAIGYKELIPYFENAASLDECIERIKLSTRHYAKRQLSWFRRMDGITKIYVSETDEYKNFLKNIQNTIAKSKKM